MRAAISPRPTGRIGPQTASTTLVWRLCIFVHMKQPCIVSGPGMEYGRVKVKRGIQSHLCINCLVTIQSFFFWLPAIMRFCTEILALVALAAAAPSHILLDDGIPSSSITPNPPLSVLGDEVAPILSDTHTDIIHDSSPKRRAETAESCSPTVTGYGPRPSIDTASEFSNFDAFYTTSENALNPDGWTWVFDSLQGEVEGPVCRLSPRGVIYPEPSNLCLPVLFGPRHSQVL